MRPVEGQPKSRQPISQAILFMIGGGSYIEYQVSSNLSLSEETAENAISNRHSPILIKIDSGTSESLSEVSSSFSDF